MKSRVYALSFVHPAGSNPPQVTFSVPAMLGPKVDEMLIRYASVPLREEVVERLGNDAEFELFSDLFEPGRFGHGGFGMRTEGDEVNYAISLRGPERILATALTIEALLSSMRIVGHTSEGLAPSNRRQIFDIDLGCSLGSRQSLDGWFDAAAGEWFARRGAEGPPEPEGRFSPEAFAGYPLKDDGPRKAMEATWRAITPLDLKEYADHCGVTVKPAGNFALICLGSNVAAFHDIAPEMNTGHPGRFTCWNLDNLFQLVTTFAGLAALYEALAKDLG